MTAWYKRKRKFTVQPIGSNSEINVTPLVDVVLVLLIIFMVVTPLLQKDLDVRVPQTEEVESVEEVPPDQVLVEVTADGEVRLNHELVEVEGLQARLEAALGRRRAGDRLAFFLADDRASYALVVRVLDVAKLAGAETLGMMTETPPALAPGVAP